MSDQADVDRYRSRLETLGAADDVRARNAGRVVVVGFVAMVLAIVGYFALGMPGMDHGGESSMNGMDMDVEGVRVRLFGPDEFDRALTAPSSTLMNVHVPYEGQIAGTDLFVPYDELDATQLPQDKAATLLIYCMSGNMSAEAAQTLSAMGFTDIVELDGGMRAWSASGRPLDLRPDEGG